MDKEQILQRIGFGAAAGLIGTAAMQAVRTSNKRTEEPGAAPNQSAASPQPSVRGASAQERAAGLLKDAASMLSTGFGSTGAALAALRGDPKVLVEGALLGTGVWAVGQLVGKAPHQTPGRMVWSVTQHMFFGIATVSAYRRLRRKLA